MNIYITRFCLKRLEGKLINSFHKSALTFSVIKQLRCSSTLSTKYAVYEPEKKIENSSPSVVKILKENEHPNSAVVAQKIMSQSLFLQPEVKVESLTTELKHRLEELNVDFNDTLSDIEKNHLDEEVTHESPDSVEAIAFLNDFKKSTSTKPNPLLGTEDRNVPPSKEPCRGCGATLQCQHKTFPGFLPSEFFNVLSADELKTTLCQRCFYIRNCDAFQEVSTNPKEFAELITKIKSTKSMVVMVVDVMDIHGSIIPNVMDYIGNNHPVIIVGNKADLLTPDCPEYLKKVTLALRKECYKAGIRNIKNCTLVSAKTGFGIERLITALFSFYKHKVDAYIVGSANAGKSSLFNTLLASDYCKNTARDLIQRATISVWPGTTLNLLKFPIMRPSSRTNALRVIRLKQKHAEALVRRKVNSQTSNQQQKTIAWELKDVVKVTDVRTITQVKADDNGAPWGQEVGGYIRKHGDSIQMIGGPEKTQSFDPEFYHESYWTYDTPGLINPSQIMHLLTKEEAPFIAPKTMLVPQCVLLKPGDTIFVSGLSRLDYFEGDDPVIFTVHCGPQLPIVVVPTQDADQFYLDSVGTAKLGIPIGSTERILKLPSLCGKEYVIKGTKGNVASSDIQLSSLGWISAAPKEGVYIRVRAYTPGGRGLHQRTPALLPNDGVYRGKKITCSPFFRTKQPGWVMRQRDAELLEKAL